MRKIPLLLVFVTACAGGNAEPVSPETAVLYPPAPGTPRIQFLTQISSEIDLGKSGQSLLDKIVGGNTDEYKVIAKPYGLAIHDHKIYVSDLNFPGLDIVDLDEREITFFRPPDPFGLRRAVNCFVDENGLLYVTDSGRKQVVVYDTAGAYVATLSDEEDGDPVDVFVTADRIYVSQLGSGKGVRVYDRATHAFLFSFPDVAGTDSTGLAAPTNIFVTDAEVYVSDMLKQQVYVYTTDGEFLRTIGRPGTGPSTFQRPKGIAVDPNGLVYVVDAAFQNIQVFDPDGRLLMFFGGGGGDPGNMALPAKVVLDYDHLDLFEEYVMPGLDLQYLIFVTNQYGPARVAVYGFVGPTDDLPRGEP